MKIAVIDGQGGSIGKHIISKLRAHLNLDTEIYALGTNAIATTAMLKGGANEGATGENTIVYMANRVDIIIGSVAILIANSMCGEMTPKMVAAVGESKAKKYLLPMNRNDIHIVGAAKQPLPHQIEELVLTLKTIYNLE
ncbi:MAG: DUF3842 family protein [Bacillota bacterium]|nr:DUF3842 family protein [Bacillota bacterium]